MQYVSRRNPGSRRRVRNAGVAVRTASYQSIQSESTARLLLLARLVHRSVAALLQGVVRVAPTRRDKLRVPCSTVSTRVLLWFTRVGGDPMSVRRLAVIDKLRRPRKRRETILPKPVSPSTFPHRSGRLTPVAPCDSPLTREREALHVRPPARRAVPHDASWPAAATASFRLALRLEQPAVRLRFLLAPTATGWRRATRRGERTGRTCVLLSRPIPHSWREAVAMDTSKRPGCKVTQVANAALGPWSGYARAIGATLQRSPRGRTSARQE